MRVSDYLSEVIDWGGLPSTRGEIITTMLADGFSRQQVDWYLAGFDSGIERRRKAQQ